MLSEQSTPALEVLLDPVAAVNTAARTQAAFFQAVQSGNATAMPALDALFQTLREELFDVALAATAAGNGSSGGIALYVLAVTPVSEILVAPLTPAPLPTTGPSAAAISGAVVGSLALLALAAIAAALIIRRRRRKVWRGVNTLPMQALPSGQGGLLALPGHSALLQRGLSASSSHRHMRAADLASAEGSRAAAASAHASSEAGRVVTAAGPSTRNAFAPAGSSREVVSSRALAAGATRSSSTRLAIIKPPLVRWAPTGADNAMWPAQAADLRQLHSAASNRLVMHPFSATPLR